MTAAVTMTWPDYRAGLCRVDGQPVPLTPFMIELVSTLLMNRGRLMTYGTLIEILWPKYDGEPDFSHNTLKVQLSRIRKVLPGLICTVWGLGLKIEIEDHAPTPFRMAA